MGTWHDFTVIRHKEDTEDLCQDIFVKVYFKLKRFRFESTFKTWLYRMIINSINNYFRKHKLLTWFGQDLKEELVTEEHDDSTKKKIHSIKYIFKDFQNNCLTIYEINDIELLCKKKPTISKVVFFNFFNKICKKANNYS